MQNFTLENQERPSQNYRNDVCGSPDCCNCPPKGPRPRHCPCAGNKNYKDFLDCSNSGGKCARELPITTCTNYKYDLWDSCNENPPESNNEPQCCTKPSLARTWNCAENKAKEICKEARKPVPFYDWRKENLCDFSDQNPNQNQNQNIENCNNIFNINVPSGFQTCFTFGADSESQNGNGNGTGTGNPNPNENVEEKPVRFPRWIGRKVYDPCKEDRHYHLRFTTSGEYGRGWNNSYSTVCGKPRCCVDCCTCLERCCDLYDPCLNDKY